MYLYLVRHGESEAQAGQQSDDFIDHDPGLSEDGIEQATRFGNALARTPFLPLGDCQIWTSTQNRARQTAAVAISGQGDDFLASVTINLDDRLRELQQPGLHNLPEDRIQALYPHYVEQSPHFKVPGGESHYEVSLRVGQWLNQAMRELSGAYHLLVFTHGHVIRTVLWSLLGFDTSFLWKIMLGYTSITKLEWDSRRGWLLHWVGAVPHWKD